MELEDACEAELRRMNDQEKALQALRDEGVDALNVLIDYRSLFDHDPLVALNIINIVRQAKARTEDPLRDVSAYAKSVITGERRKLKILTDSPAGRDGKNEEPRGKRPQRPQWRRK